MNNTMIKDLSSITLNYMEQVDHCLRNSLKKSTWFAGLYCASLLFLTATGAGVRWALSSI